MHSNWIQVNDIEFNVHHNPLVKIWSLNLLYWLKIKLFCFNGSYTCVFEWITWIITVRMIDLTVCLEVTFKNRKCFRFYFRLNFRFLNYLNDYGPNDRSEGMFRSDFQKPEVLPVIFSVYFRSFFAWNWVLKPVRTRYFTQVYALKHFLLIFFDFFFKS